MTGKIAIWSLATILAAGAVGAAELSDVELERRVERYLEPYREIGHLSGTLLIARAGDSVCRERGVTRLAPHPPSLAPEERSATAGEQAAATARWVEKVLAYLSSSF